MECGVLHERCEEKETMRVERAAAGRYCQSKHINAEMMATGRAGNKICIILYVAESIFVVCVCAKQNWKYNKSIIIDVRRNQFIGLFVFELGNSSISDSSRFQLYSVCEKGLSKRSCEHSVRWKQQVGTYTGRVEFKNFDYFYRNIVFVRLFSNILFWGYLLFQTQLRIKDKSEKIQKHFLCFGVLYGKLSFLNNLISVDHQERHGVPDWFGEFSPRSSKKWNFYCCEQLLWPLRAFWVVDSPLMALDQ